MTRLDEAFEALKQGYLYDEYGQKCEVEGITRDIITIARKERYNTLYRNLSINDYTWHLNPIIKLPNELMSLKEVCVGNEVTYDDGKIVLYIDSATKITIENTYIPKIKNGTYKIVSIDNDMFLKEISAGIFDF